MLPWVLLTIAIVCEVCGTVALKYTDGFTRPIPVVILVAGYGSAFYLMSIITRHLPLSIVYAVWSGAGTALIAIIGAVALSEGMSVLKAASLILIVAGIVGLNLAGSH